MHWIIGYQITLRHLQLISDSIYIFTSFHLIFCCCFFLSSVSGHKIQEKIDFLKSKKRNWAPTVVNSKLLLWYDDHSAILVTPKKPHTFVSGEKCSFAFLHNFYFLFQVDRREIDFLLLFKWIEKHLITEKERFNTFFSVYFGLFLSAHRVEKVENEKLFSTKSDRFNDWIIFKKKNIFDISEPTPHQKFEKKIEIIMSPKWKLLFSLH